jgi:hypothetical protein
MNVVVVGHMESGPYLMGLTKLLYELCFLCVDLKMVILMIDEFQSMLNLCNTTNRNHMAFLLSVIDRIC